MTATKIHRLPDPWLQLREGETGDEYADRVGVPPRDPVPDPLAGRSTPATG